MQNHTSNLVTRLNALSYIKAWSGYILRTEELRSAIHSGNYRFGVPAQGTHHTILLEFHTHEGFGGKIQGNANDPETLEELVEACVSLQNPFKCSSLLPHTRNFGDTLADPEIIHHISHKRFDVLNALLSELKLWQSQMHTELSAEFQVRCVHQEHLYINSRGGELSYNETYAQAYLAFHDNRGMNQREVQTRFLEDLLDDVTRNRVIPSYPREPLPERALLTSMRVILSPQAFMYLIKLVFLENLDGYRIAAESSFLHKDYLGTKVIGNHDIIDDAQQAKGAGSKFFDKEGTLCGRTVFFEQGRFITPMLSKELEDQYAGYGLTPTGHYMGDGQVYINNFEFKPSPDQVSSSLDASVPYLYIESLRGYSADAQAGDFMLESDFITLNRRGAPPLSLQGTVSGNLFALLRDNEAIFYDRQLCENFLLPSVESGCIQIHFREC